MRRFLAPVLAVLSFALVVWATVAFASTTDTTAVGRSRTVITLPPPPPVQDPPSAACVASGSGGQTSLQLSGSCRGPINGQMRCVAGDEALDGSLSVPLADQRKLTVTVVVPEFDGAGDYEDVGVYAQVANPTGAQRWTDRSAKVSVSEGTSISVQAALRAEPGTGTLGVLRVSGHLSCGQTSAG